MKTNILLTITIGTLIFTISAFSMVVIDKNIKYLPFAVLGFILLMIFKGELTKQKRERKAIY